MLAKSSQIYRRPTMRQSYIWIIYLNINDSLIIKMMQVSLNLRCSRISLVLILYFDFNPCCLRDVTCRRMIGYILRYSKVIE